MVKDIIGYEGLYQIDTNGNIWSIDRTVLKSNGKKARYKHRNLRFCDSRGYKKCALSKNGKITRFDVHRLMAIHFIPNPNNLSQVNHKDLNKQNNNINNLEWISPGDNIRHYISKGRKPSVRWNLLLCLRTGIYYESKAQAERARGVILHPDYLKQHDFIKCGNTVS